ncbi:MAG TPA: hypothetical protein VHO29_08385 [Marmoricola sp.]|nr:hypothetical protein [Marmoricola sp.]
MSFGKHNYARLLSPLAALVWIAVLVGFAGTARADSSSHPPAPQSGEHSQTSSSAPAQADPQAAETGTHGPGSSGHADHAPGTGDLTSPQPISKADANTGGANGQCPSGPYCSTRDGSASLNGNGGGKAVGKPCAGCVGKADNKNPHGQMPSGADANAGYECDTNHGIGRSNPAHTGCQSGETPPPVCVPSASNDYCGQPQPGCVPSATETCGQAPPPLVSPPVVSAPLTGTSVPAQAAVQAPTSSSLPQAAALPQTGAPRGLAGEAALAVLVMLAGAAAVATSRRRRLDS